MDVIDSPQVSSMRCGRGRGLYIFGVAAGFIGRRCPKTRVAGAEILSCRARSLPSIAGKIDSHRERERGLAECSPREFPIDGIDSGSVNAHEQFVFVRLPAGVIPPVGALPVRRKRGRAPPSWLLS